VHSLIIPFNSFSLILENSLQQATNDFTNVNS
jgi:hypothetical protein